MILVLAALILPSITGCLRNRTAVALAPELFIIRVGETVFFFSASSHLNDSPLLVLLLVCLRLGSVVARVPFVCFVFLIGMVALFFRFLEKSILYPPHMHPSIACKNKCLPAVRHCIIHTSIKEEDGKAGNQTIQNRIFFFSCEDARESQGGCGSIRIAIHCWGE